MNILIHLIGLSLAAAQPGQTDNAVQNAICGPRCVQHILNSYGIKVELIDLIRECQWPDIEKGASVDSLIAALNQRGIYTLAIKPVTLNWKKPILAYSTADNGTNIGHFAVFSQTIDGKVSVWNSNSKVITPAVLVLTDDQPIDLHYLQQGSPYLAYCTLLLVMALIASIVFLRTRSRVINHLKATNPIFPEVV
jgi:hypothetical protein